MTAQQISAVQSLAATLPKHHQRVVRKYSGQQLMELGIAVWKGAPVRAERCYMVDTIAATNHVRLLLRVWEQKGEAALLELVRRLRWEQRPNPKA